MILDGKEISKQIRLELKEKVQKLKKKGINPALAVIIVGNDPASRIYINNKKRACDEIGILSKEYSLPEKTTQEELINLILNLNKDKNIHSVLTQLPLPKHIDSSSVAKIISHEKDVDCFNELNIGKIFCDKALIFPCTPAGIIELLKRNNIEIKAKTCTIINRSNIVGKPLSIMMLKEDATVTVCHSRTQNLKDFCLKSDILISAVGKPFFITKDMVKEGAVVVDVGINRLDTGKLCGDVDFEKVKNKASYITPVPGGVGPMTIAMLMKNIVTLAENYV